MLDLKGQTIRVGDTVVFAMNSYKGYLGLGTVLEVIPESSAPGDVMPSRLKVRVEKASKHTGPKPGKTVTLGNAFRRAHQPGADLDTVRRIEPLP